MAASQARKTSNRKSTARKSTSRKSHSKNAKTSAAKRRSSSASKSRNAAAGRAARAREAESRRILQEIRLCLILALSVILMLAVLGVIGRYGTVLREVMFGLFGLMAYVFPFVLFFGYAFLVANRGNSLAGRKIVGLILTFLFLASFLQLLTLGVRRSAPLTEFYELSAAELSGGGITGGTIAWAFNWVFGTIGAYVLTIAGLIVSAIILTQKPLLSQIGEGSRHAVKKARERSEIHREERAVRRIEEREAWEQRQEEALARREERESRRAETAAEQKKVRERKRKKKASPEENVLSQDSSLTRLMQAEIPSVRDDGTAEAVRPAVRRDAYEDILDTSFAEDVPEEPMLNAFSMPSFLRNPENREPEFSGMQDIFASETEIDDDTENPLFGEPLREMVSADLSPVTQSEHIPKADAPEPSDPEASPDVPAQTRAGRTRSKKADPGVEDIGVIQKEIESKEQPVPAYRLPELSLLTKGKAVRGESQKSLMATAGKLQKTLDDFGVRVRVVDVSCGPTVTRYELQPEQGVKVSRILSLQDDIKLNLAAAEIRIEAPIPGKAAVGIEVPNKETSPVMLRDLLEAPEFQKSKASLAFAVGKDIGGRPVIADIEKMPHMLIAGATGSGKSVCINTLIMSILYKSSPDDVKMLMIDPKVVELKIYDGIPHLLIPVVTDPKKAAGALNWAVQEMEDRYKKFSQHPGVRDIRSYNKLVEKLNRESDEAEQLKKLPRIVIIVDELADLMMVASSEVEDAICRLAQLARAAGIHLIIATQRPSVNVVTGLIKANMPSRIALAVSSGTDSRTIIDMNGAEKLVGHGDMLFYPSGYPKPARVQGAYVSDSDINAVVEFLTSQAEDVGYNKEVQSHIENSVTAVMASSGSSSGDDTDEYFADAGRLIIEKDKASIGMLQRAFKIGFNRAARIMDQLADAGVVGGEEGTKPRRILMKTDEFEEMLGSR